jgi:hypothetical protein
MRFVTLLRNELRESMPWILLAVIGLLIVGFLLVHSEATFNQDRQNYPDISPGSVVDSYMLIRYYPDLGSINSWLLMLAIGLGLALAGRHFAMPFITRTWPFLLHRSVGRIAVLIAKLTAAVIALVLCLGGAWLILYWYASRPGLFIPPPPAQTLIDGGLLLLLGMVVYFGTALSVLSRNRWYTTKVFGVVLATVVIFATIFGSSRQRALVVIIIGTAILLPQIIHTFLNREF